MPNFGVFAPLFVASVLASGALSAQTLQGRALRSDATPAAGALVTVSQQGALPGGQRPHTASSTAAADGSFTFTGVPPGTYKVCVQQPASAELNPCLWSSEPLVVTLAAGQSLTALEVRLVRGVVMQIEVADPQALLETHEGKSPGAHLRVGVVSPANLFYPAMLAARGATTRTYSVQAPVGRPVRLAVESSFFRLSSASPGGPGLPFTAAPADQGRKFLYQVAGLAAR